MEKRKLLKIEMRQRQAEEIVKKAMQRKNKAKQEEVKLKREIAALKSRTSKSLVRKIHRKATSPATKKKAKRALKGVKRGFAAFQKFANKHG